MGATFDQMKMINTLRKAQKDLKNEIVEVEAGDGAVVVQITGELKVKKVSIDPSRIDLDDISELERWIENCFRDGYAKAQEIATDKMKPLMGQLDGLSGLGMESNVAASSRKYHRSTGESPRSRSTHSRTLCYISFSCRSKNY